MREYYPRCLLLFMSFHWSDSFSFIAAESFPKTPSICCYDFVSPLMNLNKRISLHHSLVSGCHRVNKCAFLQEVILKFELKSTWDHSVYVILFMNTGCPVPEKPWRAKCFALSVFTMFLIVNSFCFLLTTWLTKWSDWLLHWKAKVTHV